MVILNGITTCFSQLIFEKFVTGSAISIHSTSVWHLSENEKEWINHVHSCISTLVHQMLTGRLSDVKIKVTMWVWEHFTPVCHFQYIRLSNEGEAHNTPR